MLPTVRICLLTCAVAPSSLASFFIPEQSSVDRGIYYFTYRVRIANEGDDVVMLRNRHWQIKDNEGKVQAVK